MNYIKKAIYGPDPAEQRRTCQSLIRQNQRQIDRQLASLQSSEAKTKQMIKASAKRNDVKSARILAKEIYGVKKQRARLHTSKAQLNSVSLQVDEAFSLQKIQGSMKTSTGVMKEVNQLVRLPELMGSMQQLSMELVKSGIIDEMVGDTLDTLDDNEMVDEDAEKEIDGILGEITNGAIGTPQPAKEKVVPKKETVTPVPQAPTTELEDEEDEDDEALLMDMRERFKALQG
ncbi:Vacuolar protein-sorting-associated protein 24 [Yarrowia sp. C11]|nr:Vacuolar protein-sorting-associated protein 24 [Yarrowia sp. E02]KAG5372587.1 Vacuolar protein-sorting-associated protein 24 [Yarrowia sp. C11]